MTTAVVCTALTGENGLEIQEWPESEIGPSGVAVRVHAASMNFPDVLIIRGLYQFRPDPPFVPGSECAGVVTRVGEEITDLAVGDRVLAVTGHGAFAESVVLTPPGHQIHHIPDDMPFDHAASFNLTYGTAYYGLIRRGALHSGDSVLVLGASGGCGSAAVQVAKAAGASVVAVAGGREKVALVRELGADAVVDYQEVESLSAAVREATAGRGVDIVFDPVGGADAREQLRCLAWGGRYLTIGFAAGEIPTVKVNQTIMKGISIIGVAYGMSAVLDPGANLEDLRQLFEWYEEGRVTPTISNRFPLVQAADAFRVLHERRVLGKVVIEMAT
jgi:NADPH2:quinone reductase